MLSESESEKKEEKSSFVDDLLWFHLGYTLDSSDLLWIWLKAAIIPKKWTNQLAI